MWAVVFDLQEAQQRTSSRHPNHRHRLRSVSAPVTKPSRESMTLLPPQLGLASRALRWPKLLSLRDLGLLSVYIEGKVITNLSPLPGRIQEGTRGISGSANTWWQTASFPLPSRTDPSQLCTLLSLPLNLVGQGASSSGTFHFQCPF